MLCDFPHCENNTTSDIIRLACFHTCHVLCLQENGNLCPLCKEPLLKKIAELSETFNEGLLENNNSFPDNRNCEQSNSHPDVITSTSRNADFYKSSDWQNIIYRSFEEIVIPQPCVPHRAPQAQSKSTTRNTNSSRQNHCSHCGQPGHRRSHGSHITCPILLQTNNHSQPSQQTTQSSTPASSHNPHAPLSTQTSTLHVSPSTVHMVTFWELPAFLSQSTIGGRQGSNACTLISLLLAKTYMTNKQLLQLVDTQPLNQSWIVALVSCMLGGNQVYDAYTRNPIYLGVVEAIPLVRNSLGQVNYEEELTVCFVKEVGAAEESALSYQLSRRLSSTNAAFTIISGMTITFISDGSGNIILLDSHLHTPKGALVAKCKHGDIEGLLNWLKGRLRVLINLCTVTFIHFN